MREILFRGKLPDTGEWVEGYVAKGACTYILTAKNMYFMSVSVLGHASVDVLPVKPDTIGQYTGLTDKNGTKIFEGDIVHMNSRKFGLSGHGVVVYRNGGFAIDDRKRNRLYPFQQNGQYNAGDYRVVGNIHDNPELLEGGVSDGV